MTALPPVPGNVNQVTGLVREEDVDECGVASSIYCAIYADPRALRPPVPMFREAAGNPDDPNRSDGLTLEQLVRGSRWTWPYLHIEPYSTTDWDRFETYLHQGWVASLGVLSSELPAYLRFGFLGAHQISVLYRDRTLFVANPLAKNGSAPIPCPRATLQSAARKHGGGHVLAALFQPWEAPNVIVTIPDGSPAWGTATTIQDTRLYRSDGARVPFDKGLTRAVYSRDIVVDGKPCYQIRTGGEQVVHYLIKAHATFKPADLDETHKVALTVDGRVVSTTEV